MKKLILLSFLLLASVSLRAQYNYSEWGIGGGYSSVKGYTDLRQNDVTKSMNANIYYNYSPYLPFSLEAQWGKLSGGNNLTDPSHRYFKNTFLAFSLHGDIQLGEIMDYDGNFFLQAIKGFYFGTGIGVIHNNITDIRRHAVDDISYVYPGKDRSLEMMVPLRFGVAIKIMDGDEEPVVEVLLGYVHNITFGEGLDGYGDPSSKFKNNAPDMFRQLNVGLKINFGNSVSYVKSIR